jgi:hypothetical protein
VRAYESTKPQQQELPLAMDDTMDVGEPNEKQQAGHRTKPQ